MLRRSIVSVIVVILIAAGVMYYFYSYRNRDISTDINSMKEYTEDAATTTAVKSALALNKQVSAFDIRVSSSNSLDTRNNNVTLTGHVPTSDDKRVAEEIARSTKGVANVVNNIQVGPNILAVDIEKQHVLDMEIKTGILESILNNPNLKTQQIKVEVNNGEVKLSGRVQTPDQKAAAESTARAIPNVRNVDSNELAVTNLREEQP